MFTCTCERNCKLRTLWAQSADRLLSEDGCVATAVEALHCVRGTWRLTILIT